MSNDEHIPRREDDRDMADQPEVRRCKCQMCNCRSTITHGADICIYCRVGEHDSDSDGWRRPNEL